MLSKAEVISPTPSQRRHFWKATTCSSCHLPLAQKGCAPVAHWASCGGFPEGWRAGLALAGSWRLPGQQGMAADLKDTLLKRLSHVSADHVFSLSTL